MRRVLTTMALAGASALFSALLVATPAQAAHHSDPAAQAKHFAECLDLMINNPAKHAKLCGPGHEWTGKFSHEGELGPGIQAPPPPPVVEEDPCEEYDPCAHWYENCEKPS